MATRRHPVLSAEPHLPRSMVRDADRGAALRLLRTLLARVSRTKNTESR